MLTGLGKDFPVVERTRLTHVPSVPAAILTVPEFVNDLCCLITDLKADSSRKASRPMGAADQWCSIPPAVLYIVLN